VWVFEKRLQKLRLFLFLLLLIFDAPSVCIGLGPKEISETNENLTLAFKVTLLE
jgi:hypothetical protein